MGLKPGWIALFLFVWVIGAFLGSTFEFYDTEEVWAGTGTGGYAQSPVTTLDFLMDVNNVTQKTEILGTLPMIMPNSEYFDTAYKVLTWQFSFLYNPDGSLAFGMVYYVFFMPFVVMGVLSLILLVYNLFTGNFVFL